MKNNSIVFGMALLMGLVLSNSAFSQSATQNLSLTVDGSALLAVVGIGENINTPAVSISLAGASEAGAEVMTTIEDQSTRLRISSLVESGKTRTVSASILPALTGSGTTLSLELIKPADFLPAVANGGTTTGVKDMTDGSTQELVNGITTCWSGIADGDGYTIKYVYAKAEGATALVSKSIVVTYTISAEI
jgi:hypothetical protein